MDGCLFDLDCSLNDMTYTPEQITQLRDRLPAGMLADLARQVGMKYTTARYAFSAVNKKGYGNFESRQQLYKLAEDKLKDLGFKLK
jgi:DNA-binding transcriptional regulator PaaX